ncbi:capsular polysaccharide transport system permease protein [Poseidonocella pacifica]|uniref:Capsular polysaccharide transport system permease protein n=1 Tax=Poseidonocella pacifica TaxID=871651 RepID=A0A1I0V6A6_9RHOB|nr:hypothetical protein [Poseidonocella pacifica]SFA71885.1 capsular polysaccharide transport system permease protein [Poseidonocella pacifica]
MNEEPTPPKTNADRAEKAGEDKLPRPRPGLDPASTPLKGPKRARAQKAKLARAEAAKPKAPATEQTVDAKAPETDAAPKAAPAAREAEPVPPPAQPARIRKRHYAVLLSFILVVLTPVLAGGFYLWVVAADQYASKVGFSVRKEEMSSAVELLGGITELSGSSSSDTDILYEFIQSQKLVDTLNRSLNLAEIWSRPEYDPVFAYQGGTIEDLVMYWGRMVRVNYDTMSGLIEVRVLAFDPEDATRIADGIFAESSNMINELSAIAREDAVSYAREELDRSLERLKETRAAVTRFRNQYQMVDPTSDLQAQASLLGSLQAQLAETLIELDFLEEITRPNDPRLAQAKRRVEVIENRIADERQKRGLVNEDTSGNERFSTLVGEYEGLIVEREFAEQSYVSALATSDAAKAEARRKSRYLAAYMKPTRAERAEYPRRGLTLSLFALFITLIWGIGVLITYSLRDRR